MESIGESPLRFRIAGQVEIIPVPGAVFSGDVDKSIKPGWLIKITELDILVPQDGQIGQFITNTVESAQSSPSPSENGNSTALEVKPEQQKISLIGTDVPKAPGKVRRLPRKTKETIRTSPLTYDQFKEFSADEANKGKFDDLLVESSWNYLVALHRKSHGGADKKPFKMFDPDKKAKTADIDATSFVEFYLQKTIELGDHNTRDFIRVFGSGFNVNMFDFWTKYLMHYKLIETDIRQTKRHR